MRILDILSKVEESDEYQSFVKDHKDIMLAHVFKMMDDSDKDDWQVGYVNKKEEMTTFTLADNNVSMETSKEVFKRPDATIKELKKDNIKVDVTHALETAEKIQATEFSAHTPMKVICILQVIEDDAVYNITYVTQSFNVLNMRIKADSGEVIKKKLTPIMDFKSS